MTTINFGNSFKLPGLRLPNQAKQLDMIWVPSGTFTMGSREDDPGYYAIEDGLPFLATLSTGFWLGRYPITQAHWQALMASNPSHFQRDGVNHPVENVSWNEAIAFCEQLNLHMVNSLPTSYRFSLPTQMQWEYACRAGTQTPYHSGTSTIDLMRVAWCAGNSNEQTHPVGEKEPNTWGFYDMHGNVDEWCIDTPVEYPNGPVIDWVASAENEYRIIRGGSWDTECDSGDARSACCRYALADGRFPWIGFRLCLRFVG